MFNRTELIVFIVIGITLCFIPVLGHAHFESASLITLLACFYLLLKKTPSTKLIHTQLLLPYLAFVPLFLKGLLFGCLSFDGIAFWIVVPIPSLLLVHSLRNLVNNFTKFDRLVTIIIFFCLTLYAPVFELKHSPIVYLYNSIWGYWPGPIYDEEVHFPIQLLIHRFYVIIWSVLLWELARKQLSLKRVSVAFICLISLFISFRSLGIIRTTTDIARTFSSIKSKENITLYYNSTYTDELNAAFYFKRDKLSF